MRTFILLLLLGVAVGCGATSTQTVPLPNLDLPLEYRGSCRIYLFRGIEDLGVESSLSVVDQDYSIGRLAVGDFLCWERPPGLVRLNLTLERRNELGGPASAEQSFPVGPGRVYYGLVQLHGIGGAPVVRFLTERVGASRVRDLDPASMEY